MAQPPFFPFLQLGSDNMFGAGLLTPPKRPTEGLLFNDQFKCPKKVALSLRDRKRDQRQTPNPSKPPQPTADSTRALVLPVAERQGYLQNQPNKNARRIPLNPPGVRIS